MKCIKVDLPNELEYIEIEPLFDLHIGSKKCDYKEIQRRIDRIKNNPNVYAVLGGDIINYSTVNSVASADVYEEPLTPMQQIKKACELLLPIKDKLLCAVSGNHERRASKDGIDLDYWLSTELGIQNAYDLGSIVLFIRFGKNTASKSGKFLYTVYCTHGSGGGSMVGGKANRLAKIGQIVNTDVVIVGHTHTPLTFKEMSYQISEQTSSVFAKETTYVNASATLDYESYAELSGMKPNAKACPIIRLSGKRKDVRVIS